VEKAVSLMTGQEDDEASEMRVLRIKCRIKKMDYHGLKAFTFDSGRQNESGRQISMVKLT
jgi:hypothetical protein